MIAGVLLGSSLLGLLFCLSAWFTDAIDDIRPWIGWARARPIHLDLEQELPLISEKVNVAG